MLDIVIVGGGVVGTLVARELSRYALQVVLLEKEADIGAGASSANSGIIHAGYDPLPGTLKAGMNRAGNPLWDELASELNFEFLRCGSYVVALDDEELSAAAELLERGRRNGIPGLEMLPAAEMRRREPAINPQVKGALWAPTSGVVDTFGVTIAAAENAVANGVKVMLDTACTGLILENGAVCGVRTNHGDLRCRWVINAAGLYADEIMHMAGVHPEFKIEPRRGQYSVLDRAEMSIDKVLFPVPGRAGKGILVTITTHGNTIIGPNSETISDKEDESVTREGLDEIWHSAQRLIPGLNPRGVIATFSGLRATGNGACTTPGIDYHSDFIIENASEVRGLINLAGIESPGLTSSPAIARRVVELLKDGGEKLTPKSAWNPLRPSRPHFRTLSPTEQDRLIAQDPAYGRIICRCELVTEGEIVREIHAPIPARTYDAVKRRTWCGTGRCLGAFDVMRVTSILARELGISPLEVSKKGPGSEFLVRATKEVEVNP